MDPAPLPSAVPHRQQFAGGDDTHTHIHAHPTGPFPSCLCTWELNRLSKHHEQTAAGLAWERVGLSSSKHCPDREASRAANHIPVQRPYPSAVGKGTSRGHVPMQWPCPFAMAMGTPWGHSVSPRLKRSLPSFLQCSRVASSLQAALQALGWIWGEGGGPSKHPHNLRVATSPTLCVSLTAGSISRQFHPCEN